MIGFEREGEKIFLSCSPCDMRKSIDSLAVTVQMQFGMDPFNQSLYVFCNKRCDKCKILRWSNNGWWLYYRKLSKGVFRWKFGQENQVLEVSERQFRWLLDGMSIDQPTAHKAVKQRILCIPIPGSFASAELLAGIINSKYVNHVPLARIESEFDRMDSVVISRQTMSNWVPRI